MMPKIRMPWLPLMAAVLLMSSCAPSGEQKNTEQQTQNQEQPTQTETTTQALQTQNNQAPEAEQPAAEPVTAEGEQQAEPVGQTQTTAQEQQDETRVTAENPEALLSSPGNLMADTLEAVQHDRSQSKIAYVGAWASSPDGCALIDQSVYDGFAIVTPGQIRSFEERCEISAAPMTSNPMTLNASCFAEGDTFESKFVIEMLNGQSMRLKHEGTQGFELVRCNLPN